MNNRTVRLCDVHKLNSNGLTFGSFYNQVTENTIGNLSETTPSPITATGDFLLLSLLFFLFTISP